MVLLASTTRPETLKQVGFWGEGEKYPSLDATFPCALTFRLGEGNRKQAGKDAGKDAGKEAGKQASRGASKELAGFRLLPCNSWRHVTNTPLDDME